MKKFVFLVILLPLLSYSQADLSPKVQELLYGSSRSNQVVEVWIQFSEQLNFEMLAKEFEAQNLSNHQRRNRIYQLLHQNQAKANAWLKDYLYVNASQVSVLHSYWLSNSVVLSISTSDLQELASQKELKWIELSTERMILMESVGVDENNDGNSLVESVNSHEPGLGAINAPAMWKRGYTGLGRLALIMDTGIWEDHPALGGRWKGRRASLESTWFGYNAPIPKDQGNSHGTHVTGTILGLEKANNDTIGNAFNAQFIVSDFVAGNHDEIKPLHIITPAFEWALDPDGDTSTYDDVPDVINNSWGHSLDTSEHICTNPIGDAIAAVQLSGTAVVWSAGNNGPGGKTIGSPATITRNPYLVFTVGAVNGNISTYPIASFSSRGPSHCVDTGKLSIKPEVVAPGVNVRSCIGTNSYANYQGTSMSGPHVAGAVLLLKEAFPNLPGEKLLEALYLTAHDLGPVGEENTYGNGMIDVDSAFVFLSITTTPVPAKKHKQDIVLEFSGFQNKEVTCDKNNVANLMVINTGDKALISTDLKIIVESYGGNSQTILLVNDLAIGDTAFLNASISFNSNGKSGFTAKLALNSGYDDALWNNTVAGRWDNIQSESLPFVEQFDNKYAKWTVENPDRDYTWNIKTYEDSAKEEKSVQLAFHALIGRNAQRDALISPKFDTRNFAKLNSSFKYAYTTKASNVFVDTLKVYATSDCDLNNWKLIANMYSDTLITAPDQGNYYWPKENEWKTKTLDLSAYDGHDNLILKFEGINDYGNNLYLDDIRVEGSNVSGVVEQAEESKIMLYPNPTNNSITLEGNLSEYNYVEVHSTIGQLLFTKAIESSKSQKVDLNKFPAGSYIVVLKGVSTRHFSVVKE